MVTYLTLWQGFCFQHWSIIAEHRCVGVWWYSNSLQKQRTEIFLNIRLFFIWDIQFMKYFQVTYNLSVCFTLWKPPSSPLPPVSELRCVCNWSLESPGHKCFQAVLTLAVGQSCMFGCAIALLTSFQMSPPSSMGKVSQDPRYWE